MSRGMFGDLFKSDRDKSMEKRRKERRAFRRANRAVETVKDKISALKKKRDSAWQEARQYMKSGNKLAAKRSLQTCRANEVLISKLEVKKWTFDQLITKLELAKTDNEFAGALNGISAVVDINPEKVDDVLGEIQVKLGDQVDIERIWDDAYKEEMKESKTSMDEMIPSLDEMENQLEEEVAADVRHGDESEETEHPDRLSKGRKKLEKLLGDE